MRVKILVMVAVMVLAGLATAPAAARAQEADGSGTVWARGMGSAEIHGHGVVDITCRGVGVVTIKGAEVLQVHGRGRRHDRPDGTVVLAGWLGRVHVEGADLAVSIRGGVIEFRAQGTGWVFLKGHGRYRINGAEGAWTPEGIRLDL